jgi:hypothetical protein
MFGLKRGYRNYRWSGCRGSEHLQDECGFQSRELDKTEAHTTRQGVILSARRETSAAKLG